MKIDNQKIRKVRKEKLKIGTVLITRISELKDSDDYL